MLSGTRPLRGAAFLISGTLSPATPENCQPREFRAGLHPRDCRTASVSSPASTGGGCALQWWRQPHRQCCWLNHVRYPSTTSPTSASAADQLGTLTFDDLGGGSAIIGVYAGVQDRPEDRQRTGTFQSGDTVRAICQTTGRMVSSDTSVGERAQQSNVWVRIDGSPGVQQYASLTYADVSAATLSAPLAVQWSGRRSGCGRRRLRCPVAGPG